MGFSDHQLEIYLKGLQGERPQLPMRIEDLEACAREALSPEAYGYVAGGAGEATMSANREAFDRRRLVPRMLRDVAERSLATTVLGHRLPAPVALAPIGALEIVHSEAEFPAARAAATFGLPFTISTLASRSLETVAEEMGEAPRWFQLYWPRDSRLTRSLLRRAEDAGYSAVLVTLDTKLLAWRERDLENAFLPFLQGKGLANYTSDPVFQELLGADPAADVPTTVQRWSEVYADPAQTWADVAELREMTELPIVLKGILHPDDARRAVDCGADGVLVSNHGGRQVAGAVGALDALPAVVDAVGDQLDVLFDSGIRGGEDVVKALALGARTVLVGRPYVWGLALEGEAGVRDVLARLLASVELNLALSGHARLDQLGRDALWAAPQWSE